MIYGLAKGLTFVAESLCLKFITFDMWTSDSDNWLSVFEATPSCTIAPKILHVSGYTTVHRSVEFSL